MGSTAAKWQSQILRDNDMARSFNSVTITGKQS